jgi:hypothetical protein
MGRAWVWSDQAAFCGLVWQGGLRSASFFLFFSPLRAIVKGRVTVAWHQHGLVWFGRGFRLDIGMEWDEGFS